MAQNNQIRIPKKSKKKAPKWSRTGAEMVSEIKMASKWYKSVPKNSYAISDDIVADAANAISDYSLR